MKLKIDEDYFRGNPSLSLASLLKNVVDIPSNNKIRLKMWLAFDEENAYRHTNFYGRNFFVTNTRQWFVRTLLTPSPMIN